MYLNFGNIFFAVVIVFGDLRQIIEAQISTGRKSPTTKQKPFQVRMFHNDPKYSKYKSEGELRQCNLTFHLLHYSIYNPQKECEKYSSIVLGLEELMVFIHEIRSSSTPLGEMVFPLRNYAEKDTKFQVDYTEFHPDFNLDISLKKSTTLHENHVVCVKFSCPTPERNVCPVITQAPVIQKAGMSYQGNWFKIGISLIIILVLAIIIVLIYLIATFYPKRENTKTKISLLHQNPNIELKKCNSFDTYDFLRKMDNIQPSISDTYAKPISIHPIRKLSDENNINNCKSSTNLMIDSKEHNQNLNTDFDFNPKKTDHLELLNNKNKTMPLIKKRYNYDSSLSPPSPGYSLMDQDLTNFSSRTNPSFRSVKYIPPLKLVENEF